MIEVNLLPGAKKRGKRGGGGIPLPDFSNIPADPYVLGSGIVGAAAVGILVWMYMGVSGAQADVQVALQDAREDSANFADLIERNDALEARRDSVGEKVAIIQEIDAGRYIWPHILDEVGRALPDFTWLTSVVQVSVDQTVVFEIQGRAGNPFALTTFMNNLESSDFIRAVQIIQTQQVQEQDASGDNQTVYSFQLEASWQEPSEGVITTVPLFQSNPAVGPAVPPDTAGSGQGS